ncbi:cytoplasmic protein [Viridibacillus sp. NPDC093762]|uniref:cytoplasmic protein n=1 Tax=Viridibacillus sp. NPDC093762 TaxID=3390720 RepID=UPI003D084764
MSLLLTDPMVHFPSKPQLLPHIKVIMEEAVTISGSVDGPFRLNGTRAKEIVIDLLPFLVEGVSLEALYEKSRFSKEEVNQLLEILFVKSCLMQKTDHTLLQRTDHFYLRNIAKYKNHDSLDELKAHLDNSYIYIVGKNESLITTLKRKLETFEIQVLTSNDFTAPQELPNKRAFCIFIATDFEESFLNDMLQYMDVLYVHFKEQQLGPLFSKKGIMPSDYIQILESLQVSPEVEEVNEKEFLNYVTLYALREIGKISNTSLIEGFYKKEHNNLRYYGVKSKLYEHEELNPIAFEQFIQFSASKFINASTHLAHYKSKNLKLSTHNQASILWKKLENIIVPDQIDLFMRKTLGYKNTEFKYKRFTPSGGNINSHLIFYVNNNEKAFNGKGIYFYNNNDDAYYQVLDDEMFDITNFSKLIGEDHSSSAQGYFLLGNDVDIIAEKYNDFSFKISNLNTGILLSNLLSLSQYADVQLKVHTHFHEQAILHLLGIERSNEIINFVVEVL